MDNTTTIITAILTSTLFNTLVVKLLDLWLENRKKKNLENDVNAKSDRLTLLYVLKSSGRQYLADGEICETDYRAFEETYKTYKDLGGDGYADKIHEEVTNLPITK